MSLRELSEQDDERFEGHDGRECGEHRTTGGRAWCFECSEWCYPEAACKGCELPALRAELEAVKNERDLAVLHVAALTPHNPEGTDHA